MVREGQDIRVIRANDFSIRVLVDSPVPIGGITLHTFEATVRDSSDAVVLTKNGASIVIDTTTKIADPLGAQVDYIFDIVFAAADTGDPDDGLALTDYDWDVKRIDANNNITVSRGILTIAEDQTRTIG